jgi:hypothetical protein
VRCPLTPQQGFKATDQNAGPLLLQLLSAQAAAKPGGAGPASKDSYVAAAAGALSDAGSDDAGSFSVEAPALDSRPTWQLLPSPPAADGCVAAPLAAAAAAAAAPCSPPASAPVPSMAAAGVAAAAAAAVCVGDRLSKSASVVADASVPEEEAGGDLAGEDSEDDGVYAAVFVTASLCISWGCRHVLTPCTQGTLHAVPSGVLGHICVFICCHA